jgi:hypothetical protein
MTSFAPLARALGERGVRYLLIGVAGANLHAHSAGVVFSTQDRDLFLPRDPANLLLAWQACEVCGLSLWSSGEPLDQPRDLLLAERVIQHAAHTTATDDGDLRVDLTLVMAAFAFEDAWRERRLFQVAGVEIPAAHCCTAYAPAALWRARATGREVSSQSRPEVSAFRCSRSMLPAEFSVSSDSPSRISDAARWLCLAPVK